MLTPPVLALIKLLLVFALMMGLLRLRFSLWLTIFCGGFALALLSGFSPPDWALTIAGTVKDSGFLMLELMIFGIILLSSVQAASGQSARFVAGLEGHIRSPLLRLVVFPALIGLLPMPGGALFSCPMLDAASKNMAIGQDRKVLINYWFRHTWELAWPLYPGYILASSLLHLPLYAVALYTFPLVVAAFFTGRYFYLRNIPAEALCPPASSETAAPWSSIFLDALPFLTALGGAALLAVVRHIFFPELSSQLVFPTALLCASAVALYQGRGSMAGRLRTVVFSPALGRMLLLILAIYSFKDIITGSDMISALGQTRGGPIMVYALFALLPFICGLLTGIMVGFVGTSFPLLLALAAQTGMQDHLLPLALVGLVSGNCGQLLSPLHICLAVSCEYFKFPMSRLWPKLCPPCLVQVLLGFALAAGLYFAGVRL